MPSQNRMETLNDWLTLIANIGVIAGLIFLALEIQQSNRIAVAATEIEVRNSFSSLNESIYSDPELTRLIVRLADGEDELTLDEDIRVFAFVQQLLNTYMAVETASDNGMVPESTFDAMESDFRGMMTAFPRIRDYFRRAFDSYPEATRTEVMQTVDKLLGEFER